MLRQLIGSATRILSCILDPSRFMRLAARIASRIPILTADTDPRSVLSRTVFIGLFGAITGALFLYDNVPRIVDWYKISVEVNNSTFLIVCLIHMVAFATAISAGAVGVLITGAAAIIARFARPTTIIAAVAAIFQFIDRFPLLTVFFVVLPLAMILIVPLRTMLQTQDFGSRPGLNATKPAPSGFAAVLLFWARRFARLAALPVNGAFFLMFGSKVLFVAIGLYRAAAPATDMINFFRSSGFIALIIATVVFAIVHRALARPIGAEIWSIKDRLLFRAISYLQVSIYALLIIYPFILSIISTDRRAVEQSAIALGIAAIANLVALAMWDFDKTAGAWRWLKWELRYREFWRTAVRILQQFPQPKDPQGYVFLTTLSDSYAVASVLLLLCRLRQLNWATIIIDTWAPLTERTGNSSLDRFFNYQYGLQQTLNFDWKIDWERKIVEAAGINFYHPLWEGLSRHYGRYTLTLEEPGVKKIFHDILAVADSALMLAFRICNTVAGKGMPVRILGGSGQFVPNAVFNIFCREIGKDIDMHFVWVQQGYQTYYKDNAMLSTKISIENITKAWPYSNPYLPMKKKFDAWCKAGQDVPAIMAEAENWIQTNRATANKVLSPAASAMLERIKAHRKGGGAVVCILGKMVFDLSTPWEHGPAHSGIDDWLNHSVEAATGADNVLMLIKPHPYESRPEIAGHVAQFFTDLIETPVPPNVVILAHDWFNLHTLMPYIDLGVLWNGTSGLELGLHEIPVVMCSDWGPIDYPIRFPAPKDRKGYVRMIRNPRSVKTPKHYREKCALLLKYAMTEEVMIPYDYCARPLTNAPFGPPIWYEDQLQAFIEKGDPYVDMAARRVM
jgi:hypothetical protein